MSDCIIVLGYGVALFGGLIAIWRSDAPDSGKDKNKDDGHDLSRCLEVR